MATERKLIPSHYGCMSASDLILLMSSKIKFMYINGDECGTFRINLCQQQQVGTIINAYALKLFSIGGPFFPISRKRFCGPWIWTSRRGKTFPMQRSTMSSKAKSYQVIIRKGQTSLQFLPKLRTLESSSSTSTANNTSTGSGMWQLLLVWLRGCWKES